jgi:hypothetical protein
MGSATDEARAEDHVGLALKDRLQEHRVLPRVVLEVGVLDEDDVAGGRGEPRAQRGALALVPFVEDDRRIRGFCDRRQQIAGAVRGAVVDDDDLAFQPRERHRPDASEHFVECVHLVVDRNDDRELQGNPPGGYGPGHGTGAGR